MIRIKQATKKGYIEFFLGGVVDLSFPSSKTRRGRVQGNGHICPTLCTENEIYRIEDMGIYLSKKGCRYVLDPARGMCTDINKPIAQTVTAKGTQNWTGSFISDDIDHIEKDTAIGSTTPVKIFMKDGGVREYNGEYSMEDGIRMEEEPEYAIRKLTPRENLRLMDVPEEYIDAILSVNSNTQAYKQAGNSIVVNVMCKMFKNLNINQKE